MYTVQYKLVVEWRMLRRVGQGKARWEVGKKEAIISLGIFEKRF